MIHPIKRRILIALFGLGTIGGFGAGFHSLRYHAWQRHAAFEKHVAQLCTDAAKHAE
jgi:hypothetical protein